MKVIYYLCCLFFFSMYAITAQAYISLSSSVSLIEKYTTKTKTIAKPKLSNIQLSKNIKFASIYFIYSDEQLKGKKISSTALTKSTKCPQGMVLYAGQCEKECTASEYPFSSLPDDTIGKISMRLCRGIKRYKYDSCYVGWDLVNGKCEIHTCPSNLYPYTSQPDTTLGTLRKGDTDLTSSFNYCQTGEEARYGFSSCNAGWDLINGKCEIHSCPSNLYPYTSNPGTTAGKLRKGDTSQTANQSYCKSGTSFRYGYSECYPGWYQSGSQCFENTCEGYGSTTSTINKCQVTATSCQKGSTTVYKCTTCQKGYKTNSSGICEIIMCPTGSINTDTYWCSDAWRCLMPAN